VLVFLKRLQRCISQICCCMTQVQRCLWLFCTCPACLCRKSSTIVIADIASTLLVMLWLMYIIHALRENEEDAQNIPKPVRISEFLKVNAVNHHQFLAAVHHHQFLSAVWFTSQCHAVSPHASQMLMHTANEKPLQDFTIGASYQLLHAIHASPSIVCKASIAFQIRLTA